MHGVQTFTVASGQGVSSAFVIDADRPVVIFVPSHAARGWSLGFAPSSDSTTFHAAYRPNADGHAGVCSGGGMPMVGIMRYPHAPWARIECRGAALAVSSTAAVMSVTVMQLNRF